MTFMCRRGHRHRTQDGATNCGWCKRRDRGTPRATAKTPEYKKHAALECPECGKVCQPRAGTADGGAKYTCRNYDKHTDSRARNFRVDGDGEVHW